MVGFINTFLSYLLVVIVFVAVIICAILLGKKLREMKDSKDSTVKADTDETSEAKEN